MAARSIQDTFEILTKLMQTTISEERERCAKICEDYAAEHERGSPVTSMAEDAWGNAHGKRLAALIRRGEASSEPTPKHVIDLWLAKQRGRAP